ncbi:MAG TPA: GNAT family N-acetyltransferase [Rudaea sp.]|nr:GNAT family N-acetyltransferase [Rudaea sp.]
MNTSPVEIRIRAAQGGDIGDIVRFNAAMALETEHRALDVEVLRAGVAAALGDARHGFYLVAEAAAQVVACLLITYEWSDWRNGQWWWLQSVYVDPQFRRHGVFRALYDEVERRVRDTPGAIGLRLYVERDNRRAQQTYAALGMHETDYRLFEKTLVSTRASTATAGS